MSSSYPHPPLQPVASATAVGAGTGAAGVASTTSPPLQQMPVAPVLHQQHQQHHQLQAAPQTYAGNALPSPVAQPALNGIQHLPMTTASPGQVAYPSPVAPVQYAAAATQQMAHGYMSPTENGLEGTATSPPGQGQGRTQKTTRLRRACDMCSSRKIKCDETKPECGPCVSLGVECTFNRTMKRRGPPNKHAEAARAAKEARIEKDDTNNMSSTMPHNPAESRVSLKPLDGPLDAESIAPLQVVVLLVDDFYTYIYPLTPFPHEPTFRQQLANREDRTDPEFLALLASMVGALVASFPRAARLHLKQQHSYDLFPRSIALVDHCRTVALQARGPQWGNKGDMSVYDAAASYFLGLAAAYTLQWKYCRRFMAEAMSLVRELGYHRSTRASSTAIAMGMRGGNDGPTDYILDETGKRIFWVIFLGVRSMTQLGESHNELTLPPPTPPDYYPSQPTEVDDQWIESDRILPQQPEGSVSIMSGFNKGIAIYMTMNDIVGVELSYGINSMPWDEQKAMLHRCLIEVKNVTIGLPPELELNLDNPIGSANFFDDAPGYQYVPPAFPQEQPAHDFRRVMEQDPYKRRLVQFEIQKTNIYASQLATRSYYVERYFSLRDAEIRRRQPPQTIIYRTADPSHLASTAMHAMSEQMDEVDLEFAAERERIVQNLMTVLMSIPQRNMEPNGASLINKIRQVASTLLNDSQDRKGPLAMKAEEYLHGFVDLLTRLEKTGPGTGGRGDDAASGNMTLMDEEEELRSWADLREHQLRFAQSGGFL